MKYFANWKLNLNIEESIALANKYLDLEIKQYDELIVSPAMYAIDKVRDILGSRFKVYPQDVSRVVGSGGLTGEVTATMLKKCGFAGSLIGHIERRIKLNEKNEEIRYKLMNCLNEDFNVVLSVGEYGKDQYSYEDTINILSEEFQTILAGLSHEQTSKIIIAYEDTEGVSTLNIAPVQINLIELNKKIDYIKSTLKDIYKFQNPLVLYGGSVSTLNVQGLKTLTNLDGFVIGKSSLDIQQMKEILK